MQVNVRMQNGKKMAGVEWYSLEPLSPQKRRSKVRHAAPQLQNHWMVSFTVAERHPFDQPLEC